MANDGESLLFCETWGCTVKRYWFDGSRQGQIETIIPNLPGYPDNINRASDGNYWLALVGMRTPSFDLALRMPGFRRRMAKRLPPDEWMYPNINVGCIVKIDERGTVLQALWDRHGTNHPMITSMREHRGHLYIGGLSNNRIGRIPLASADRDYVQYDSYWKGQPFWKPRG
jgi:ribose transport system permease protein